jgi:NAD(P)-dependent dehydrogenase (short-subunit alcohol dehydrogenase family)
MENNHAFGKPGSPPTWSSSAKSGVGTALNKDSEVWFSLSHGILNEIYYPRVDNACIRTTQKKGVVVNNSSVHEELPMPNFAAHCASKGGMQMVMRNLAVELAPLGIRINNVAPGAIKTPINAVMLSKPELIQALQQNISLHRLGEPEDVAAVVAFLACDDSKYVTGATYYVDGGLTWNYSEQ